MPWLVSRRCHLDYDMKWFGSWVLSAKRRLWLMVSWSLFRAQHLGWAGLNLAPNSIALEMTTFPPLLLDLHVHTNSLETDLAASTSKLTNWTCCMWTMVQNCHTAGHSNVASRWRRKAGHDVQQFLSWHEGSQSLNRIHDIRSLL